MAATSTATAIAIAASAVAATRPAPAAARSTCSSLKSRRSSQQRAAASASAPGKQAAPPSARRQPAPSLGPRGVGASRRTRPWAGKAAAVAQAGSSDGQRPDVVIVGGGLAGLSAALTLHKAGKSFLLLEASDGWGGRVRTDEVDGFLLDRGFQIFLSGYPECREVLDYAALELRDFYAGALVRFDGYFHRVADPFRHPLDGIKSLANPIGTVPDKVLVGLARLKSLLGDYQELLKKPETTIAAHLVQEGFSPSMVDRFFRPFLGGIFFDRQLGTSSRLFEFVLRMLATGSNCLPAGGIGAIPAQMAGRLPEEALRLGARVGVVDASGGPGAIRVHVEGYSEELRPALGVIVAADAEEAKRLLGERLAGAPSKPPPAVGTVTLYYDADKPPNDEAILYLNGDGTGLVNNLCFPSSVSRTYAPPGRALVSVSLLGAQDGRSDDDLFAAVKAELAAWYGPQVDSWRPIRLYRIPYAQPNQAPPTDFARPVVLGGGLYVCGDHRDSATFDGAMVSGRRAASQLLADAAAR